MAIKVWRLTILLAISATLLPLISSPTVALAEEPFCPDSAVAALAAPDEITTVYTYGKIPISVTFTIANLAPSVPMMNWWLTARLYKDGLLVTGDPYLSLTEENYPVDGSPLVTLTDTKTLYLDNEPPGYYELEFYLSPTPLETSYLLDNNRMSHTILFKAPNLEVIECASPTPESIGDQDYFQTEWTIINNGNSDTTVGWTDQLWASVDNVLDRTTDRLVTGNSHLDLQLHTGETYTDTFNAFVPTLIQNGERYLILLYDDSNNLYESAEDNWAYTELPPVKYRLSIGAVPPEGGTLDPAPGDYLYAPDTMIDITEFASPGWDFLMWGGDETITGQTTPSVTVKVDGNKTVNDFFVSQTYTLTLIATEGGAISPVPGVHTYWRGDTIGVSAFPYPGYVFVNWTGDLWEVQGDPGSRNISVTMHNNWTLTANFAPSEAPQVSTYGATEVSRATAVLNGQVIWLGSAPGVFASFQWGTAPGQYEYETPEQYVTNLADMNCPIAGLLAGRNYYYRAKINCESYGVSYGDEQSFTTDDSGDANGDGYINSLDITMVERIIVGLENPTPGADARKDGRVNSLDITRVERIIAGLD